VLTWHGCVSQDYGINFADKTTLFRGSHVAVVALSVGKEIRRATCNYSLKVVWSDL
jgi:hypothetical protein